MLNLGTPGWSKDIILLLPPDSDESIKQWLLKYHFVPEDKNLTLPRSGEVQAALILDIPDKISNYNYLEIHFSN